MKLFGIDIAAEINAGMGSGLRTVTITRTAVGSYGADPTAGRTGSDTAYTGRGFISDGRGQTYISGTLVEQGDRIGTVLGASLSIVPEVGDTFTIDGTSYQIVGVQTDPAAAVYECLLRSQ